MADRSLNDLNYGRPGLANYDLENRGWTFSRQPAETKFVQVSSWRPVLSASMTCFNDETFSSAANARRKARRLVRDHSQLVPASEQLHVLESVSEAILSTTSTYDPIIGDRLSFGSVFLERSGTAPKRIAALPAGESCNVLRLVVLREEKHGWSNDRTVWLSGPSFKNADSGYWNEEAAPIQQVCFAQTENGNSFLALRLPVKTVVFSPIYHRGRRAAKQSPYYDLPPSLIDAHPITSISIEQTGGSPHSHVSFNPDYQFQVGIVDQQSAWSIWDIDRKARDEYVVTCMVRGDIVPPDEADSLGEDGWARILWAGDINTVLICNRRHLSIVDIKGPSFVYLPSPALVPSRSSEWILDVQRHPKHNSRFFVLTSTHVLVLAVTTSSAAMDMTTGEAGAAVLLSRRHYQGDEDFTLQLSVQSLVDDKICVFLHSQANDLVQVYHFQEDRLGFSTATLSMDPVLLDIPIPNAKRVMHLQLDPLQFGTQAQSTSKAGPGNLYMEAEIQFYQFSVTLPDLSVYQTIVYVPESGSRLSGPIVIPIEWDKVVPAKHSLYASKDMDDVRDFIVPDGLDALAPTSRATAQAPNIATVQESNISNRTVDQTLLYTALNSSPSAETESTDINVVIDHWRRVLADSMSPDSGTLMEALSSHINVLDVDDASAKLNELSVGGNKRNDVEFRRIASATALHWIDKEEPTISSLYDAILHYWIAPLPLEVPVRIRQHKERLARRIAAEVMLASSRISYTDDTPYLQSIPKQDHSIVLPVLPSASQEKTGLSSISQWSSQSLAMPSSSAIPSSQPPSSPLLSEFFPSTAASDPLARLRKHLSVNEDVINTAIPQSVTQLLSHWQLGADPHDYDWDATERTLRLPDDTDETSQAQREKERRKKERREKRQKREDELMRAKTATQPSYPRSSPGPMFGDVPSSSQVASQAPSQVLHSGHVFGGHGGFGPTMPLSQVEPGRYGGRPDKKKKKGRGRISGF